MIYDIAHKFKKNETRFGLHQGRVFLCKEKTTDHYGSLFSPSYVYVCSVKKCINFILELITIITHFFKKVKSSFINFA